MLVSVALLVVAAVDELDVVEDGEHAVSVGRAERVGEAVLQRVQSDAHAKRETVHFHLGRASIIEPHVDGLGGAQVDLVAGAGRLGDLVRDEVPARSHRFRVALEPVHVPLPQAVVGLRRVDRMDSGERHEVGRGSVSEIGFPDTDDQGNGPAVALRLGDSGGKESAHALHGLVRRRLPVAWPTHVGDGGERHRLMAGEGGGGSGRISEREVGEGNEESEAKHDCVWHRRTVCTHRAPAFRRDFASGRGKRVLRVA